MHKKHNFDINCEMFERREEKICQNNIMIQMFCHSNFMINGSKDGHCGFLDE